MGETAKALTPTLSLWEREYLRWPPSCRRPEWCGPSHACAVYRSPRESRQPYLEGDAPCVTITPLRPSCWSSWADMERAESVV